MVIYTVSYPPRLVPISLLLPGDDTSKVTASTTAALSPAAALAANATRFAATVGGNVTGRAATGRRRLLSPAAALALGDLAYESSAATGQHHVAALEDEGYISVPHKPGCESSAVCTRRIFNGNPSLVFENSQRLSPSC